MAEPLEKVTALMGHLVGVGRIAEVYTWGDNQVLKLFRPEFPQTWVDVEAQATRVAHTAGVCAPAVGDVVEIDGRKGIVYERVTGPTMLLAIAKRPWLMPRVARQLAELHAQMHARTATALPSQRERLRRTIQHVDQLSDVVKVRLLARLDALPDGDTICHGDYHPDNVIKTERGPIIIDWLTASRGNPLADVARTTVLFLAGGLPPSAEGPQSLSVILLLRMRRIFYRIYERRYCALRSVTRKDIAAWLPIQAAVRLSEGVAGEETRLLAWVDSVAL